MVNLKLSVQLAIRLYTKPKVISPEEKLRIVEQFKLDFPLTYANSYQEDIARTPIRKTLPNKQPWAVADILKYKDIRKLPYKESYNVIGRDSLQYFYPEAAKMRDDLERELSKDIENSRENVREALEKIIREDFLNYG